MTPGEELPVWKRINRRGGFFLLVAVLFGLCASAHFLAHLKMGSRFELYDDRTNGEMRIIHFLHNHFWVVLAYFGFLLTVWFWLVKRSASRWDTAIAILLLSIPCLLYFRACLHISSKLITLGE